MKYDKPPLSIEDQIDLLTSRGMDIPDRERAARYLTHINYYRFRAYWLPFEEPSDNGDHRFRTGTQFDHALSLYIFDRKFRLLVLEAIERVEVSFRTQFAYVLAMKYGSHAYLDEKLFKSPGVYAQCLSSFREELGRSRETFIEHYKSKYNDPEPPPVWASCEIMSFGQMSKWFQNIKLRNDRRAVASPFRIDERVLGSFMHHLSHIRNLAAHHSRLWNRRLTFTMMVPRQPQNIVACFNHEADRKIYNTIAMLGYMLNVMSPGSTWTERLRQLLKENTLVNPADMGFPTEWQNISLWRERE